MVAQDSWPLNQNGLHNTSTHGGDLMAELKAYKHETGQCIGTILVGELKQYFQ